MRQPTLFLTVGLPCTGKTKTARRIPNVRGRNVENWRLDSPARVELEAPVALPVDDLLFPSVLNLEPRSHVRHSGTLARRVNVRS